MREVIDLDDRVGMVVDEKGTATARTARRRRDNLIFHFQLDVSVIKQATLVLSSPYMMKKMSS